MEVKTKLRPGGNGTRILLQQYGGQQEQVRPADTGTPGRKAWHLEYRKVIGPGLARRIFDPDIPLPSADMPAWFPYLPGINIVMEIAGNTASEIDSLSGVYVYERHKQDWS